MQVCATIFCPALPTQCFDQVHKWDEVDLDRFHTSHQGSFCGGLFPEDAGRFRGFFKRLMGRKEHLTALFNARNSTELVNELGNFQLVMVSKRGTSASNHLVLRLRDDVDTDAAPSPLVERARRGTCQPVPEFTCSWFVFFLPFLKNIFATMRSLLAWNAVSWKSCSSQKTQIWCWLGFCSTYFSNP